MHADIYCNLRICQELYKVSRQKNKPAPVLRFLTVCVWNMQVNR